MKKQICSWLLALSPILLLCQSQARADNLSIGFGPSLDNNTHPQMLTIGHEKIWGEFSVYTHCGAMFESPWNPWCAVVPSVHIESTSGIFTRAGVGPALFGYTDDRLSSHFNFNISWTVGLTQNGWEAGLEADHFSNAGLWPPNLGSDHLCLVIAAHL